MSEKGQTALVRGRNDSGVDSATGRSFAGHDRREWARLPLELGGLPSLIIGSAFFGDCPAIPDLTAQIVTYGVVGTIIPLLRFHFGLFKLPPNPTRMQKLIGATPDDPVKARAKQILDPLQLIYFPLAIWGAVLTFGRLSLFGGSPECKVIVYLSGFITSILHIVIFGLIFVVVAAIALGRAIHGEKEKAASETGINPNFEPHEP